MEKPNTNIPKKIFTSLWGATGGRIYAYYKTYGFEHILNILEDKDKDDFIEKLKEQDHK